MADALIIIGILGFLVVVLGFALWVQTHENARLKRGMHSFAMFDPDGNGKPGGRVKRR